MLNQLGVDTNVFNTDDPKQDRTAAIGPATDLWMHVGPSRISGRASAQYLYFKTFENQRAWNTDNKLRWDVPLGRLTPFVAGAYINNKSRPGYEIDSRVRQASQYVSLGTALRLGRTTLTLAGRRSHVVYDEEETFQGTNLAAALNEVANVEQLAFKYKLTSLTSFVVEAEAIQDRFAGETLRNADSIKVLSGFQMKPSALIAGNVFVGVRRFQALSPIVPDYQGPIAAVDATFTARATQLNLKLVRDITFSYQPTQPYYTLTDAGLTIVERLSYSWDVVVRGSRQVLDYKRILSLPLGSDVGAPAPPAGGPEPSKPAQVDTIEQYGGGIGYRFGRTLRLGLDGIYYRRRSSDVAFREYTGLRAGLSVTYGLPQ